MNSSYSVSRVEMYNPTPGGWEFAIWGGSLGKIPPFEKWSGGSNSHPTLPPSGGRILGGLDGSWVGVNISSESATPTLWGWEYFGAGVGVVTSLSTGRHLRRLRLPILSRFF